MKFSLHVAFLTVSASAQQPVTKSSNVIIDGISARAVLAAVRNPKPPMRKPPWQSFGRTVFGPSQIRQRQRPSRAWAQCCRCHPTSAGSLPRNFEYSDPLAAKDA
jgi:hypothetical protein